MMRRALFVAVSFILAAGGIGGCTSASSASTQSQSKTPSPSQSPSPSGEVVVDYTTEAVKLEVGTTLVINFGEINSSIGDSWELAVKPDGGVLGDGVANCEFEGESMPGAPCALTYAFGAVGAGETTIEFQYAYRGATDAPEVSERVDVARTHLVVTVE